jgi:hypothetical protein
MPWRRCTWPVIGGNEDALTPAWEGLYSVVQAVSETTDSCQHAAGVLCTALRALLHLNYQAWCYGQVLELDQKQQQHVLMHLALPEGGITSQLQGHSAAGVQAMASHLLCYHGIGVPAGAASSAANQMLAALLHPSASSSTKLHCAAMLSSFRTSKQQVQEVVAQQAGSTVLQQLTGLITAPLHQQGQLEERTAWLRCGVLLARCLQEEALVAAPVPGVLQAAVLALMLQLGTEDGDADAGEDAGGDAGRVKLDGRQRLRAELSRALASCQCRQLHWLEGAIRNMCTRQQVGGAVASSHSRAWCT